MKNAIFVFPGNCRTFIHCFDSQYNHVISKLFSQDYNIYLYFYLKLTDPGPKGQDGWNFEYNHIDYNTLIDKINEIKEKYKTINIEYKILESNEISDNELMAQVKDRSLYTGFYITVNTILNRGLHIAYNFEQCGKYILEKEESMQSKFDYIIYIRPDLFFTDPCNNIETYNESIVTLCNGPNICNNDHMAIIPRNYLDRFFFDRINIYRNNTSIEFTMPEEIYWHTIKYEVKQVGNYYIKRS